MAEETPNEPSQEKPAKNALPKVLLTIGAFVVLVAGAAASYYLGSKNKSQAPEESSSVSPTPSQEISNEESVAEETETSSEVLPTTKLSTTPSPTLTPPSTPTDTPTPTPTTGVVFKTLTPLFKLFVFQITEVTASVDTSLQYKCPPDKKTFHFTGKITSNKAGTATYRWERSDGLLSSTSNLTFSAAETKTVTTYYSDTTGIRWVKLHVLTPNDKTSGEVVYEVRCL